MSNYQSVFNSSTIEADSIVTPSLTVTTLTPNAVVVTDSTSALVSSSTTDTEIGHLAGVTSNIQLQLNDKLDESGHTADMAVVIDSTGKITTSSIISRSEIESLDGVTSNIQNQLDDKLEESGHPANMAIVSDSTGKITTSAMVSRAEIECLDGVTSNIQTQINNLSGTYLPLTGGTLTGDLILDYNADLTVKGYANTRKFQVLDPSGNDCLVVNTSSNRTTISGLLTANSADGNVYSYGTLYLTSGLNSSTKFKVTDATDQLVFLIDTTTFARKIIMNADLTLNGALNSITQTQLSYLTTLSSNVQTQLNNRLQLSGGTLSGQLSLSGYNRIQLSGGNSSGFLWSNYSFDGDGIYLGYNYHYNGGNVISNSGGATSAIKVGYGTVDFFIGGVNTPPSKTLRLSSTAFYPNTDGGLTLGGSSNRWSTVYGNAGNFSGDVAVGGSGSSNKFRVNRSDGSYIIKVQSSLPDRIDIDTDVYPSADDAYYLGQPSYRWKNVYAKNLTVGDITISENHGTNYTIANSHLLTFGTTNQNNIYEFYSRDSANSRLIIFPGYREYVPTSRYVTYEIPGSGTHYFWDSVEIANDLVLTSGKKISCSGSFNIQSSGGSVFTFDGANFRPLANSSCSIGTTSYAFWSMYSYNYYTASDRKLKQGIEDLDLGLEFIEKLKPKAYSYTADSSHNKRFGLIAQDVEEILEEDDITSSIVINDNDTRNINYSELIAPLIKAVQELSAIVKQQQNEIEQLKNLVNS